MITSRIKWKQKIGLGIRAGLDAPFITNNLPHCTIRDYLGVLRFEFPRTLTAPSWCFKGVIIDAESTFQ